MAEGIRLQAFGFRFSANPTARELLPVPEFPGTVESSCMGNDIHPKRSSEISLCLKAGASVIWKLCSPRIFL